MGRRSLLSVVVGGIGCLVVTGCGVVGGETDCPDGGCEAGLDSGAPADADMDSNCGSCPPETVCNDLGECVADQQCTPEDCDGCCLAGMCRLGTKDFACGSGGEKCTQCSDGASCTPDGECISCQGCRTPEGDCVDGTADDACGSGGEQCVDCSSGMVCKEGECVESQDNPCSETCSGCCEEGVCRPGDDINACGTKGETCKTCAKGFECNRFGDCTLDPNGKWQIVAIGATIVQSSVDVEPGNGAPDPYLEVEVGGMSGKTKTVDNTYTPSWGEVTVDGATASNIKSETIYRMYDSDSLTGDEDIVSDCKPGFSDEDFKKSKITHTCVGGGESGHRADTEFRLVPK